MPNEQSSAATNAPVLLYDGVCGFCNKSVQFVIDRDRNGTMRFAALQSSFAANVLDRHPHLKGVDSVVFVEPESGGQPERVAVKSTAAIKIARYLGGIWRLAAVGYAVPKPVRDFFYDLFAKNRYRFFGRFDACAIPPKEVRSRFIDVGTG